MKYLKIELPHGSGGFFYPTGYANLEGSIVDHLYVDDKDTGKTTLCLSIKGGTNWKTILGNQDRVVEVTKKEMVD